MKYRSIAEKPLEKQIIESGRAPMPMLDSLLPLVQVRSLMAGERLGIFEGLGRGSAPVEELARKLCLDPDSLELLLRVLVCAGYLGREGDRYRLEAVARDSLLSDGALRCSGLLDFVYIQWQVLERLEEVLQSGRGFDFHASLRDTEAWSVYQQAMLEAAQLAAPYVATLVPVSAGARHMLDVGGSHGLFGAELCRRHPPLRSEVLDLPDAVEHGRELALREGVDDVVTHRAGNALTDDLGGPYDVALIANVVHHLGREQNALLLKRIRQVLGTSGTLAIWDLRRPDPAEAPDLLLDGFALFIRLTSPENCYADEEYRDWLHSAGFVDIRIEPTPFAPSQILVTART